MKKLIAIMFLFLFIVGCPAIDVKEVKMQIREDCIVKFNDCTSIPGTQYKICKLSAEEFLKRASNDDDKAYTKDAISILSRFTVPLGKLKIDNVKELEDMVVAFQKVKDKLPPTKNPDIDEFIGTFVSKMDETLIRLKSIQTVYLGLE